MLIAMAAATVAALALGLTTFEGVVSAPPSLGPTFLKLDIIGALQPALLDAVVVFFLLALFDSIGTLVGVAGRIGLAPDGSLPRVRQALLADATGTVVGACLGTSTVTAYIESSTGVAAGGRTGLASVVTAAALSARAVLPSAGQDDRRRVRGGKRCRPVPDCCARAHPRRCDDDGERAADPSGTISRRPCRPFSRF